jgi:succinate-acetate transporter protein
MTAERASAQPLTVKDTTANPAPLGLLAFGLTTILLNIHNAGYYGLDAMVLCMGIFYGGFAQLIAGAMEWKKNNTFATTAFLSYGFFWLVLGGIITFPKLGLATAPTPLAMGWFLSVWGLMSVVMFIGTFRLNRALQLTFGLLVVLFGLLAAGDFLGNKSLTMIAGYEGIACGLMAMYTGLAQVINEVYRRVIMPIGPVV